MIGMPTRAQANVILDAARIGKPIPAETIDLALFATGDLCASQSRFPNIITMKKPLHIKEARCAGRDPKANGSICPDRDACARHRQLEVDRSMGIDGLNVTKVYTLPFVKGNKCSYWIAAQ